MNGIPFQNLLQAGKADPPPPPRLYAHPDSPVSVDVLRKQVISFEKVKLTNNELDKSGQVIMHLFFHFTLSKSASNPYNQFRPK